PARRRPCGRPDSHPGPVGPPGPANPGCGRFRHLRVRSAEATATPCPKADLVSRVTATRRRPRARLGIPPPLSSPVRGSSFMAISDQQSTAKKDVPSFANDNAQNQPAAPARDTAPAVAEFNPTQSAPPRSVAETPAKESLIAADLTIEGKIE